MPTRSSKKPRDLNALAHAIVEEATGEANPELKTDEPKKNPHAVALGKLGGAKGGKARAKALSKSERTEIARKAAKTRWKGKGM